MLFIAEIGLNHNGNFGLLHELIRQAARSGADIAKFQLGWRAGEGEMNQITPEVMETIVKGCAHCEVEPMFSIFTPEAYELAKKFDFKRYKIASRTVIDDPELVTEILDEGKETFVSLGFWEGKELPFSPRDNLKYLFCISKYPCPAWEIKDFPKDFSCTDYVGFSDHTIGIETALLAVARGARVIEKHFTLDKSDVTIRDHALSATPDEFGQLVELGRAMRKNLDLGV